MATKMLGDTIDIHGGGLDLQFPHHENELAQSESFTGKPFATFWMHNGLLKVTKADGKAGGKMGGSLGNAVNMADLFQQYSPETVRFILLGTHYRSPIEYSPERLDETTKSLQGFYRLFERYERLTGKDFYALPATVWQGAAELGGMRDALVEARARFLEFMDDDFNTGGAIGVMFELLSVINRFADQHKLDSEQPAAEMAALRSALALVRELANLLGIFWEKPAPAKLGGDDHLVSGLMELLIELRNNLRAEAKKITAKDDPTKKALFGQTDLIRQRLNDLKVTLEDRATGTTWRVGT